MSIQYQDSTIKWILGFRIITLLICFYVMVPFDLYINST